MITRPGAGWRNVGASLAGAAVMITIITIASRLLGFARWMLQARTVGYAEVGNAYASANTLPNVLFEVAAGGALAGALIPLLAIPLAAHLRSDVNRIASAMITWAMLALVPIAAAVVIFARPIAGLFVETASPAQLDLTTYFLRVFALQIPLYAIGVVLTGVLQAQKRFFWPAFAPILSTLTVMAAYLVFQARASGAQGAPEALPAQAAAWLAWGTTAGVAAMSLPLLIPTLRTGVRLRPRVRFPAGVARRASKLALAGIGALLAQQLAVLITLWLANNRGGIGVWPVFQYTQAVYLLPYAVLAVPLATSAFPRLADRIAARDMPGFASLAASTTRAVLLLSGVGAGLLIAVAAAVTFVFIGIGRGDAELMRGMSLALTVMAPGLIGFGVLFHVSRALYALERARWAVVAAGSGWLVVVVVSVVASWILVPHGTDGPATLLALGIGNSAGMITAGVIALAALRRAAGHGVLAGLARTASATVLGAALGALAGRMAADYFGAWWTAWLGAGERDAPGVVTAILSAGAGALVCFGVIVCSVWLIDRGSVRAVLPGARGTSPGPHPVGATHIDFVLGSSAGGVVRHVAQVAHALAGAHPEHHDRFHPVVRVLGPADLAGHFGALALTPLAIGPSPHPRDALTVVRLRAHLRGVDVVHAHGLRAGALTVLAARTMLGGRRPRVIVTLHNITVGGRSTRAIARVLERVVARGADVVLGVSMDIVESVRALGARDPQRALVPAPPAVAKTPVMNAAAGDGATALRDRISATRASLGATAPTSLIVTVGRLAPQKGLDTLLDAAALLTGLGVTNVRWALAGGGPLAAPLAARIEAEGLPVDLLGARDDVADLLAAADVVASTAQWEGQPIGIQEALRAGAAIVATDAGGTSEVTGERGAVVVPVGDAEAIATQVARLLEDDDAREAQQSEARARAAELPTLAELVTQLRCVYRGPKRS